MKINSYSGIILLETKSHSGKILMDTNGRSGIILSETNDCSDVILIGKTGKRKVQGVPQSQTAALSRPQEEEETDKSKQAQTEQTYEKH